MCRRVDLVVELESAGPEEHLVLLDPCGIQIVARRIDIMHKVLGVLRPYLVTVLVSLGFLESVVLQGNHHLLLREVDLAQLQGGVLVLHGVGLLIVDAAVELEREVVLAL